MTRLLKKIEMCTNLNKANRVKDQACMSDGPPIYNN